MQDHLLWNAAKVLTVGEWVTLHSASGYHITVELDRVKSSDSGVELRFICPVKKLRNRLGQTVENKFTPVPPSPDNTLLVDHELYHQLGLLPLGETSSVYDAAFFSAPQQKKLDEMHAGERDPDGGWRSNGPVPNYKKWIDVYDGQKNGYFGVEVYKIEGGYQFRLVRNTNYRTEDEQAA